MLHTSEAVAALRNIVAIFLSLSLLDTASWSASIDMFYRVDVLDKLALDPGTSQRRQQLELVVRSGAYLYIARGGFKWQFKTLRLLP